MVPWQVVRQKVEDIEEELQNVLEQAKKSLKCVFRPSLG